MADDDKKARARDRMRRLREERRENDEIARIMREIKLLQEERNRLRVAQLQKRGCREESLAGSLFEPLVAEHVAEPFTPRKQGAKHERSPNLSSGNGREKSGKPLEPQAPPTSKREILKDYVPPRSSPCARYAMDNLDVASRFQSPALSALRRIFPLCSCRCMLCCSRLKRDSTSITYSSSLISAQTDSSNCSPWYAACLRLLGAALPCMPPAGSPALAGCAAGGGSGGGCGWTCCSARWCSLSCSKSPTDDGGGGAVYAGCKL